MMNNNYILRLYIFHFCEQLMYLKHMQEMETGVNVFFVWLNKRKKQKKK